MFKELGLIFRFLVTEGFITVRDFISDVRYELKQRRG
jgi:hypothetical protein